MTKREKQIAFWFVVYVAIFGLGVRGSGWWLVLAFIPGGFLFHHCVESSKEENRWGG